MPTYDYQCDECGYEFELFQSMTEAPIKKCPKCKSKTGVRRLIGNGAGIIFKGSGFYETDYKRKESSGSSGHKFDSSPKSETKSETKSEAKTESKSTSETGDKKTKKEAA